MQLSKNKTIHLSFIDKSVRWRYSSKLRAWWLEFFHGNLGPAFLFMSNVHMTPLGWDSWTKMGLMVAWRETPIEDTTNVVMFQKAITAAEEDGLDNLVSLMEYKKGKR